MEYNNPNASYFRPPPETINIFADFAQDEDKDEGEIIPSNSALKLTPQPHCRRKPTAHSAPLTCTTSNTIIHSTRPETANIGESPAGTSSL
jgi:hypothetical protein